MGMFLASYQNECTKLISRKKYIVLLCIGVGICLIWAGLGQLISGVLGRTMGVFSATFSLALTPTPMSALPLFLQIIVPFIIFMCVTDLITVEGADNTMKSMIYRPIERWKLYFSKILAVMTYAAVYLFCVFVVCVVLALLFGSMLHVSEFFIAFASYALTLAPLCILTAFAALVALFGRSGTLTMFILLFLYLMLNALPIFFPFLNEMLFTSYLGWYRLWIGALPGTAKLIHMLLIVLGYGVVFFTAGSLLFDKKDY
jgi:ABC-2 type transport system permease protein